MFRRQTPIPEIFYSEETEEPFRRCIDCDGLLLDLDQDYTIQKVFVRNEAVFEFAMCRSCTEGLRTQLSEETQQAYREYLFSTVDLTGRVSLITSPDEHEFSEWIETCFICNRSRQECHRFSLCGVFSGPMLILGEFPAVICDTCEIELSKLTSQKTRDRWNRFVEENFDGPPGAEIDSPHSHPLLV